MRVVPGTLRSLAELDRVAPTIVSEVEARDPTFGASGVPRGGVRQCGARRRPRRRLRPAWRQLSRCRRHSRWGPRPGRCSSAATCATPGGTGETWPECASSTAAGTAAPDFPATSTVARAEGPPRRTEACKRGTGHAQPPSVAPLREVRVAPPPASSRGPARSGSRPRCAPAEPETGQPSLTTIHSVSPLSAATRKPRWR